MGIGYLIRNKSTLIKINSQLTITTIYLLLFLLGISVGLNDKIIKNIDTIGLQAIIITIGAVLGSLICAYVIYQLFFVNKSQKTHKKTEK